jgi:membrane dipeptidase
MIYPFFNKKPLNFTFFILTLVIVNLSCNSEKPTTVETLEDRALRLAKSMMIIDGHTDLPYRLVNQGFNWEDSTATLPLKSMEGDVDFERAKAGGLDAAFVAIYIPASYQDQPGKPKQLADDMIRMMQEIIAAYPDSFGAARSPEDLESNFKKGLVSLPLAIENGAAIENDLSLLRYFQERGVCYITLTHSKDNQICDSSYDETGTWGGLSPFGRKVIAEMNKLGMIIDVSHITDKALYQVLALSSAPVIATHSSARHFTPGFERNLDDEGIQQIAAKGGMVMINFGSTFLDQDIIEYRQEKRASIQKHLEDRGLTAQDAAAKALLDSLNTVYPNRYTTVAKVADHIDHVVQLVGIDHVGLGSDFDGVGDSLPEGLKDVSQYPNLIAELLRRGYSEADIHKIASQNFLRVWKTIQGK